MSTLNLLPLVLIMVSALLVAAGATPIAQRLAPKLGWVDRPAARKMHKVPTPLLGGIAIYLAFFVALILFGNKFYIRQVVSIFVGATIVSLLGLWDDRRHLPASVKLMGQLVAASLLIFTGVHVRLFRTPWLDVPITLLWIVGLTNALNLLDNMDGLAGGIATIAASHFTLLATMSGQYLVGALAAALVGACLGFLIYNFNPARIFMGDSGSLFLGFLLAALGIKLRFPNNVYIVTWMVPVLVLGVPIFDTTLVFISRVRRGQNPLTTPGKDHVSHRLVRMGFSPREAVLILYLVGGALGEIALFVAQADVLTGYLVGGLVFTLALWALWKLEWRYQKGDIP
ncbi:MAG: undecaprenyl/decaprenyl-phosphate alpha-N-acetylglucosaminyl 1-phosphate transferase [Chloroflexi bacterium]|nr:undecaprenyl/decaprenyl-phosphate alpha-N-acetylglucosaminyl 1-phosphate transferase [Chloroflexota bacterium]